MMKRHRLTKTQLLDRMPRAFRKKLPADQISDLALAHVVNVDVISRGEADVEILWQWTAGLLMWSQIADQIGRGVDEMDEQLQMTERLIQRFIRTGHVAFTGPDYQIAKTGLSVMEQLSLLVDVPTALQAADWGEIKVNEIADAVRRGVQTPALQRTTA